MTRAAGWQWLTVARLAAPWLIAALLSSAMASLWLLDLILPPLRYQSAGCMITTVWVPLQQVVCIDRDSQRRRAFLGWWGDEVTDSATGWGVASEVVVSQRPLLGGDLLAISFLTASPLNPSDIRHWELRGSAWLGHLLIDLVGLVGGFGVALWLGWYGWRRAQQHRGAAPVTAAQAASDAQRPPALVGVYACPQCKRATGLAITSELVVSRTNPLARLHLQLVACVACPFRGIAVTETGRPRSVAGAAQRQTGYRLAPADREELRWLVAQCPTPHCTSCRCVAHARLGRWKADGRWTGLGAGRPSASFALVAVVADEPAH